MPGNRRTFLKQSVLSSALLLQQTAKISFAQQQKPNIIVVVTDDQRWDAMGCAGNAIIKTPNIDWMAQRGTRFANMFCTTSICMSSRASILMGQYERTHGITSFRNPLSDEQFSQSYPARLREAGYHTAFIGKWGLGGALPKNEFDFFDGFSGQGQYYEDEVWQGEHLTEKLGQSAVNFLGNTPEDKPFCLALSTKAPHVQDRHPDQFLHDQDLQHLYQDDDIPEPETATEGHFNRLPEFLQNSEARVRWEKRFATPEMHETSVKRYYRLITGVDKILGNILTSLKETGQDKNTVIIFTSDNGFYLGEHGLAGKWYMHEESIRLPLVIYDPRLPEQNQGQVCWKLARNIDIAPTVMELARVSPGPSVQGRSLVPYTRAGNGEEVKELFYEHNFNHNRIPKSEGIRNSRWKYITYTENDYESLFDLENDPLEENDLARNKEYSSQLEEMRTRYKTWVQHFEDWPTDKTWQNPAF